MQIIGLRRERNEEKLIVFLPFPEGCLDAANLPTVAKVRNVPDELRRSVEHIVMDFRRGNHAPEYYYESPQYQPRDPFDNKPNSATHQYSEPQSYDPGQGPYQQEETIEQWRTGRDSPGQDTTAKPREESYFLDRFGTSWWLEIASEIFSVATLLALIILLTKLDGRPLSTWTIAVSPNAVIAVLSIATRASLVYALGQVVSQLKWLHLLRKPDSLADLQHYDDASRGPFGAIRIFWTVRSASFVTYIACLAILLSLAFEPFSQQLLHYAERNITVPGVQSSVSYSKAYDYGSEGVDGASAIIVLPRDNGMTAAVVNGIYGVAKDPPFACAGASCSYPDFTTFGVCSECLDVTSATSKKQVNISFGEAWSLTTPNNLSMQASAYVDAHSGFGHTTINATSRSLNSGFAGLGMPMNTSIIRFQDKNGTTIENWLDTMEAYQCVISYCARRFVNWKTVGSNTTGEQQIIKLNNSDVPAYGAPWYRVLAPLDPADSLDTGTANNSFTINYLDGENLAEILSSVFSVSNELSSAQQVGAGALYTSSDIIASVDNMAKDVSYHMMSSPGNSTTTYGDVYATETYMRVRWPWIALLVIIAVAAAFCLITVIILTSRGRQVTWKSSLTPLLMSDIAYPLTTRAGKASGADYMQLQSRTRTIASHLTR
ncbi:hypothetical protein GGR57DRAFT_499313 [Xylariaceae sp. FL1272]|nr:hypothetical protein GGR57DRAFT_499313 [Xylariaceae sp. FL1272]